MMELLENPPQSFLEKSMFVLLVDRHNDLEITMSR